MKEIAMFQRRTFSNLIVALLLLAGVRPSLAASLLDQSFDPGPTPALVSGIDFDTPKAQTFTVGIEGILTEVAIDIERQGVEPLLFDLRATTGTKSASINNFRVSKGVAAGWNNSSPHGRDRVGD